MKHIDFLGQEIQVGDEILAAYSNSYSPALHRFKVVELGAIDNAVRGTPAEQPARSVWVTTTHVRTVKVPA